MPIWVEKSKEVINGLEVVVRERSDSRNRHGSSEYIIDVMHNGRVVHSERHQWNVWLGHCYGQLLKPLAVERAANKLEA